MRVPAVHPAQPDIRTLAADIEVTMGIVDELVSEVKAGAGTDRLVELATELHRRPDLTALPGLVLKAYTDVADALGGIQRSREAFAHYSSARVSLGHGRLSEVARATESATLELLNGLDRSLELVDAIAASVPDQPGAQDPVARLRHEVNELYGHLQFQDITAQQLAGVATRLEDIEARVRSALRLFDCGGSPPERSSAGLAFNPDATLEAVEIRQATIDAAFARRAIDQEEPVS